MPDAEKDADVVTWTMPREDALDLLRWLRHNRPLGMPDRTFNGLLDALAPVVEKGAGLSEQVVRVLEGAVCPCGHRVSDHPHPFPRNAFCPTCTRTREEATAAVLIAGGLGVIADAKAGGSDA